MSFAKQSGPPASAKQIQYLLSLIHQQGHADFREARHPLGLTQRQAGGKFTVGEASALIDTLVNGEAADGRPASASAAPASGSARSTRLDDQRVDIVRGLPADVLAAELERRGWKVTEPPQ